MMSEQIEAAKKSKMQEKLYAVPFEKGFHFYTSLGMYTGTTANSLSEFAEKLQTVPAESVVFHFEREDFQKWIRNTIQDEELTKRIEHIRHSPFSISGDKLRNELVRTVQKRVNELSKIS